MAKTIEMDIPAPTPEQLRQYHRIVDGDKSSELRDRIAALVRRHDAAVEAQREDA